jgi:hypothetical protein
MKNKKTKGILNVMIFIVMLFMITQFVFAEEITLKDQYLVKLLIL